MEFSVMEFAEPSHLIYKTRFMKSIFTIMITLCASMEAISQTDQKLPTQWHKDFVIEFSYTGSMSGDRTKGRITYDSCILDYQSGHTRSTKGTYLMKEADRITILKKLHALKPETIKGETERAPVDDGWDKSLRLGDIWLSGGTSVKMADDDRARFKEAFDYVEDFALQKIKPRKK